MKLYTAAQVLSRGLTLVGFPRERQQSVRYEKNRERFATHFIAKPISIANLWEMLQTTENDAIRITDTNDRLFDLFLMTIHYLAKYPTENEMEAKFGLSDRTIRKWVWDYFLPRISGLKDEKICWPVRWSPDEDVTIEETIFISSVDGVHCKIQEPQHGEFSKDREYWSHKFGSAGLNYEIAISIYEQQVVWINGPFKAGKHTDIKVFRAGLKWKIPPGKLVIADLGYRGESELIATPNSHDTPEVRQFKSRVLARHETFNGKIKGFSILSDCFRHGVIKHKLAFESVTVIGQFELENGSPLFDV